MIRRVLPDEVEITILPSGQSTSVTHAHLRRNCQPYITTLDPGIDTYEDRMPLNDINASWLAARSAPELHSWKVAQNKWEDLLEDTGWDEESYERCLDARIARKLGADLI